MLKLYSSNFSLNLSFSLSLIKIGKFDWRQKFSYEQILKPADKSAQESTTPLTGLLACWLSEINLRYLTLSIQ